MQNYALPRIIPEVLPSFDGLYLLDNTPDIRAIYSLCKQKTSHKYAGTVRRSNDDDELELGFDNENLDLSRLKDFCGSASGFFKNWYDPANGNHATQLTKANQPRIVNAGVVEVDATGKPTLYFDGVDDVMTIYNNPSVDIVGQPLMINSVSKPSNTMASGVGYIISKNGSSGAEVQYAVLYDISTNVIQSYGLWLEGAGRHYTGINSAPYLNQHINTETFNSGIQQGYINGTSSGANGGYNSSLTTRPNMQIGARSNNAGGTAFATFFRGYISGIIISTNPSTRNKIEKSLGKYFGIGIS